LHFILLKEIIFWENWVKFIPGIHDCDSPDDISKWESVRKGLCCICCESNIDSLLYRYHPFSVLLCVPSLHLIIIITQYHFTFFVDVGTCAHAQNVPMTCFRIEGIAQCVKPLSWRSYVLILYYNIDFTIKVILNNIQDSNKLYLLVVSRYFFLFFILLLWSLYLYQVHQKNTWCHFFGPYNSYMNTNCMLFYSSFKLPFNLREQQWSCPFFIFGWLNGVLYL
jgi:hypothetical protein